MSLTKQTLEEYLAPRRCLRDPIPDIFEAALILDQALDAHLDRRPDDAAALIGLAEKPSIRDWVSPLLGSAKAYPDRTAYVRYRHVSDAPSVLKKSERAPVRMPTSAEKVQLVRAQGRNGTFCGIPLVSVEVRNALKRAYPTEARWGATNSDCHAALLCMWLQFDHVLPHSRGGKNLLSNILVTCSGCNYGRMSLTLAEVGVLDPRDRPFTKTDWGGLERFLVG